MEGCDLRIFDKPFRSDNTVEIRNAQEGGSAMGVLRRGKACRHLAWYIRRNMGGKEVMLKKGEYAH